MRVTFADIKPRIDRMIVEAATLSPSSPFTVSQLWRECLVFLDYIRELSDAQLQYVRAHTAMFASAHWITWAHDPIRIAASDDERAQTPLIQNYLDLVKDLPEAFWGEEPVPNEPMRLLGLAFGGRLITEDVARYQRAITNLYDAGLLGGAPGDHPLFLEIGGGYGGVAHQIGRMVPGASYVILDLPEMLFWPAVFLRLNNPDQPIYLYDPETFAPAELEQIVRTHKFVLLPHYLVERLESFPRIDVAINMLSMQEMREAQVRAYCAFLERHLQGWFYSENRSRHLYNTELSADLYDIFAEYFLTIPGMKLSDHPDFAPHAWKAHVYLLTPKTHPAELRPIRHILRGSGYAFTGS